MTEHCRRLAPRRRALVRLSRLLATGAALHLPASQAHDGPLSDHAAIAPASRDTLTVVGLAEHIETVRRSDPAPSLTTLSSDYFDEGRL